MFANAIATTSDHGYLLLPLILCARPVVLRSATQVCVQKSGYANVGKDFEAAESGLMAGGELLSLAGVVGEEE